MIDKKLIEKLSKAGVDPAVIVSMLLDDDEAEQEKPEQIGDPEPAPSQPEPEKAPAETKPQANGDAILAAIEKLTGAVMAGNIRNASAGDPAQAETADTILASLIAPPKK